MLRFYWYFRVLVVHTQGQFSGSFKLIRGKKCFSTHPNARIFCLLLVSVRPRGKQQSMQVLIKVYRAQVFKKKKKILNIGLIFRNKMPKHGFFFCPRKMGTFFKEDPTNGHFFCQMPKSPLRMAEGFEAWSVHTPIHIQMCVSSPQGSVIYISQATNHWWRMGPLKYLNLKGQFKFDFSIIQYLLVLVQNYIFDS